MTPGTGELAGKVAIVTGGSFGLGAEITRKLLDGGASVVFTARGAERGQALQSELKRAGYTVRFEAQDVSSAADWKRVTEATDSAFGRLDILVNNAGTATQWSIETAPADALRTQALINLHGTFLGVRSAALAMRRYGNGGAIVNVSSIGGARGFAMSSAYGAAKGAVCALTRVAAWELAADRIRVNTVIPGFFDTPLAHATALVDEPMTEILLQRVPMGRVGNPAELAALVAFLVADHAGAITGGSYAADGGLLA